MLVWCYACDCVGQVEACNHSAVPSPEVLKGRVTFADFRAHRAAGLVMQKLHHDVSRWKSLSKSNAGYHNGGGAAGTAVSSVPSLRPLNKGFCKSESRDTTKRKVRGHLTALILRLLDLTLGGR